MRKLASFALALSLLAGLPLRSFAQAQLSGKAAAAATPSATDIAEAKASHKVWVNLDSGVYHKGGRWYGNTKNGKFMTADDAKKAGYKPAKRD